MRGIDPRWNPGKCESKVRYDSDASARGALRSAPNDGRKMSAYGCRLCGGWHLGHL
jgi:hypothetical protein